MRIDKLITIGTLAAMASITYMCGKRAEETVKEKHRELNMIDPHEETSITLENEELSTDERVKAKTILDAKKNDIYQACTKTDLQKAVREYWDCRSYFDNKESVTHKETLRAFIAYEYGKLERCEKLRQEAVQKEIASAGKPELKIVNNLTKSNETKETN